MEDAHAEVELALDALDTLLIHCRAAAARAVCPGRDHRQRGLLHVLQGQFDAAATLLADAPGLGWSAGVRDGYRRFPALRAEFDEHLAPS